MLCSDPLHGSWAVVEDRDVASLDAAGKVAADAVAPLLTIAAGSLAVNGHARVQPGTTSTAAVSCMLAGGMAESTLALDRCSPRCTWKDGQACCSAHA